MMPDYWIRERSQPGVCQPMISPFSERTSGNGIISYGLSSYGYDARLDKDFKVFLPSQTVSGMSVMDPKSVPPKSFVDITAWGDDDIIVIPPNGFLLGQTIEKFDIPREILALCLGKSTYARCGIITNVTPLEPEWRGHVTIEISNTSPLPARIYPGEGIIQVIFLQVQRSVINMLASAEGIYNILPCKKSYADRKGKYQDQAGVTLPKVL